MSERTLLLTDATGQSFRFPLPGNRISIGNTAACDVRINAPEVEFTLLRDGRDFIVVNKSRHTLRGRGLKVLTDGTAAWKCGVEARLGRVRLRIEAETSNGATADTTESPQPQAGLPLVVIGILLASVLGMRSGISRGSEPSTESATQHITSLMATTARQPGTEWKQELLAQLATCKLSIAERNAVAAKTSLQNAAALCRAASPEAQSPEERELCENIEQLAARNL